MRSILLTVSAILFIVAGAGAQVYLGNNGLTVSGSGSSATVQLGGVLSQNTDIDLNSVYNLNFKNGASNTLSILSNGKVGIGTSTPDTYCKFDVAGAVRTEQAFFVDRQGGNLSSYFFVVPRGSTESSGFGNPLGNGAMEVAEIGTAGLLLGSRSGSIAFGISDGPVGRIFSTGNWYLGASPSDAGYKLNVDGTSRFVSSAIFQGATYFQSPLNYVANGFSDMQTPNAMVNFPADGSIGISTGASSSTRRFTVLPNGNIGIGTNTPTANLQITSPSIANRDAGPYQFAINDGTINRLYAVHDVAATVMALVSPSGNVQSAIQGDESGMHIYASRGINVAASQGYAVSLLGSYNLFIIDGNEKARMSAAGFGIGTTSPSAQLHTTGTVRFAGLGNDNTQSRVIVSDADGNLSYRDAATVGSPGWAFNGSAVGALKSIGTVDNYDLPIITNNTEQMRITAAGNVLIGTTVQQGKLAVNGDIYAKKVKVTQNGWADYVFDNNYPLPTLAEVEQYIQLHKHLPDVPSAAAVEKDGVDLGDNQAVLLEKIEELTLYIIEDHKKMEAQQQQLIQQQRKIEALEKAMKKAGHK